MKITKITLATLVAISAVFTSCSDDDVNDSASIEIPETYTFEHDGVSSVSYSGQTSRLQMVSEIGGAFTTDNTATVADFTEMFVDGTGFSDADLDASGKNVNSKVGEAAADQAAVQADFVSYYTNQVSEVFPNWTSAASEGVAGVTTDSRYVNAKGLEYNQAFYKGLIGALVADQTLNDYLAKVESDSNELEEGATYTDMEHHFDEGYGYVYGNTDDDVLMYKYLISVDGDSDFSGIASDVETAFITGRTAIVNKDYDERDAQIEIIREKLSLVIGVRTVYYLQEGKGFVGTEDSFHALSEAYGFIYSLQFTHNPATGEPYFTSAEVEAYLTLLEANNGFWSVSSDTLDDISDAIALAFGFTVEQAAN